MKKISNAIANHRAASFTEPKSFEHFISTNRSWLFLVILVSTCLFTGCKKYAGPEAETDAQLSNRAANGDKELLTFYKGLDPQTLFELQQVRAATARYRNVKNAFDDSYVDIGLKLPNMGYHFLKSELVTPAFDVKRPPILVYNKNEDGSFELLAVEYAVPIDPQTPNIPPVGFFGDDDEWDFNTLNTGWWTLHAWVWKNNPDGAFSPMNPLVQVR
jgi:hypothetical protein